MSVSFWSDLPGAESDDSVPNLANTNAVELLRQAKIEPYTDGGLVGEVNIAILYNGMVNLTLGMTSLGMRNLYQYVLEEKNKGARVIYWA